jgi:4'-phosphopantetheinyl transferase EntD
LERNFPRAVIVLTFSRRVKKSYYKILYPRVKKFRGSCQTEPSPVTDRNGTSISKKTAKERQSEHSQNILNRDKVAENDRGKIKENFDIVEAKEESLCEE